MLDDTFDYYEWWYVRKWDGLDAHGQHDGDFRRYRNYMRLYAANGGLLEVSAICSAYRLQALVYDAANARFIRAGKEGRRVLPLCYADQRWSLLPLQVQLPPKHDRDAAKQHWYDYDEDRDHPTWADYSLRSN
eukprot:7976594-Prorocentrum_lima.AAC.1